MYDIIKNVITSGSYELTDILKKIDTIWLQGTLTEEQRTELIDLARTSADPENSYAPLQKQIDTLYANMTEMGKTILNLTDKVSKLDGKRYVCQMDNCVWGPDVYPAGWKLAE